MRLENVTITPISMVNHQNLQRVEIACKADRTGHCMLTIWKDGAVYAETDLPVVSGERRCVRMLPVPEAAFTAIWRIERKGEILAEGEFFWPVPRQWELSVMLSSHTDIGLHNSQFIQRYNSERFLDMAMELVDTTAERQENDRYRYTVEGNWFWSNYGKDRGEDAAKAVVENYVRSGDIGICAGIAGNVTQTYGLEEMCRSAYPRRWLKDTWDVDGKTFTMIDNNGLSWGLVQPYADAGYENLIFAPNCWNPLPSTIWTQDTSIPGSFEMPGYVWNPQSPGGGARVDVRYDSDIPLVFNWENADGSRKILTFCSTQYHWGGMVFGMTSEGAVPQNTWEDRMADQLQTLEKRTPYEMWLILNYADDQAPDLRVTDDIQRWNSLWKFPKLRTLGDADGFFDRFKARYGDHIPSIRGEITGGWYQLALAVSDVLADKFAADRALPQAETLSSMAWLSDNSFRYPEHEFRKAWEYLLCNDEHSYGASGYQGSRVFETWMQHRDWVETAAKIAADASEAALEALAANVTAAEDSLLLVNATNQSRSAWAEKDGNAALVENIPPMGYKTVPVSALRPLTKTASAMDTPVVENQHYRIAFDAHGGMRSIFDKALKRELLQQDKVAANTLLYTNNNHKSFLRPGPAAFTILENQMGITVTATMQEPVSGAAVSQIVTLPAEEKAIRIENRLEHVNSLFNTRRYHRFLYYAFPFDVPGARRLCHLNGCVAEYGKDLTGHGTDTYMASREWCCAENDAFGIGLMQLDSQIVEFDHIHPDKTDFDAAGDGSAMYVYLANDWIQMHVRGGSELNYRFRYQITSYEGDHIAAGLPQMAERFANPIRSISIPAQEGTLPGVHSFVSTSHPVRLLTLKRAYDGSGLTARVYSPETEIPANLQLGLTDLPEAQQVPLTIDERPGGMPARGFAAYGIGRDQFTLPTTENEPACAGHAPIGYWETGLIQAPRAGCGEHKDLIYLLWGQCMEENLTGYELFRSESEDVPTDTPIAFVAPGVWRVVRYEDHACKENTRYYYRVRSVFADGSKGPLSPVFSGATREAPWVETATGYIVEEALL